MEFNVTVAGVTHEDRQRVLQWARENEIESAILRREPGNPFDPNAIAVYIPYLEADADKPLEPGEKKIGYIPSRAKCKICDPKQKSWGEADYKVGDDCPTCSVAGLRGTMDRGTATKLARYMDADVPVICHIEGYLGGTDDKPTSGILLNVYVETID